MYRIARFLIAFFLVLHFVALSTCLGQDERIGVTDTESLFSELTRLRTRRASGDLSPVVIEINVPVLQLNRTIELDEKTIGEGLTVRAGEGQLDACLTGAVNLKLAGTDELAWRYTLPSNWNLFGIPPQLIVNSKLSSPARHPNIGTLRIEKTLPDRRSGFTVKRGSFPEDFSADANKADLVFLHDWSSSRLPIKNFDLTNLTLTTIGPIGCEAKHYAIDHYEQQPRFWVEGSSSLADAPGEWWIDTEASEVVMLKIPESEAPTVAFPLLETLLRRKEPDCSPDQGFQARKHLFPR